MLRTIGGPLLSTVAATALISPGGCSQTESDKAASEENGALCAPAPPGGHGLYRQVVRLYRYTGRAVSRDSRPLLSTVAVTALISPGGCSQTESDKAASEENGALCAPAPPGGHVLYRQVVRLYRYTDRAVSRDPSGCSQTESDKAASEENDALCAPAPPGGHGLYRQVVRLYRYTGRAVSRYPTATALISPGGCSQTESDKAASEENDALCAPAPPGGHGLYRQVVRLYRYTGRAVSRDPSGCSQTESDKAASEENDALCAPAPPGGHGLYRQVVRLYRYTGRAVSRYPTVTALISPGGCSQTESDKAASEENGALCAPAPPGGHGLYRQVVRLYRYTGRAVSRDPSGCSQTESDKATSEENGALCAPAPPGGHGLYRQVVRLYRYTGRAVSRDSSGCSQTESDKATSEENGALCAPAPPGGHGLYRQVVRLYRYTGRAVSRDSRPLLSTVSATALISPGGCSQTESDKAASEENGALCAPAPPGGHVLYRQVVRLYRYTDRAVSRDPTATALISPGGCSQTESDKAASEENGALCAPAPPGGHGLYRQVVRLYRYTDRAVSRDPTATALISPGGCSQTESDKAASEENGALCAPAPPGGHGLHRQVVRLYRYTGRAVSRDPTATALISPGGCSQTESDKAASEENGALCAPAPPGGHGLYRQVVRLYRYTDRAVSRDPTATALISPGGCSQTESDKAASEENGALCAPAPPGGHGLHRQVVRLYRYTGRAVSRDPTATALISPGGCSQTESDKAASEENGALCAPAPPGGHGLHRQVVRLYRYTGRAVSRDPTATALISPGGCSQTESDKAASEENGALCAPAPPGGHGLYRQVVRLYRYTDRAVSLDPSGCSQTESDKAASEENGALCAPAPPGGHGLYRQVVRLYRYTDRAVSRDPRPLLSTVSATALISPGGCSQTESDKAASEENGALCAPAPPGGHRLYRQVVRLYRYMGRGVSRDPTATALISPVGCSQTESDKAASEENGALCAPAPPGGHVLYRQVVRLYRYTDRAVSRDPTYQNMTLPYV
ncbi:hypothetical protein KXD40_009073 [Peronospora effusa]|nr:hypothetical protein KXD40_009073 [Peronospora effusa]